MELISMNCPNCSGNIKYKPGKTQMVCPYCDSVIKISMTIEDREFERNISKIANELPKYMASLKKWRIAFFITLPLALLSGVMLIGAIIGTTFAPSDASQNDTSSKSEAYSVVTEIK